MMNQFQTARLPKDEYRATCLAEARKVDELDYALDQAAEDGYDVTTWSTKQIVDEARNALDFYGPGGSAGEALARGCKQMKREAQQLQRFIRRWDKIRAERAAWVAAARAVPAN